MRPRYCKFFDRGYCSRKNDCAFLHTSEICKSMTREECDDKQCMKRHPKMCKFGFDCKRAVCTFRHTSVMYVPGGDQAQREKNANLALLKSFIEAQGEDRAITLTFFTKDGKVSANMEFQPATKNMTGAQAIIDRGSSNSTSVISRAFEDSMPASTSRSCSCSSPTSLYTNQNICFWCNGTVELNIATTA